MQKLTGFEKATLATTGMVSAVAMMAGTAQAQDAFDGLYMGLGVAKLSGTTPIGTTYYSGNYELAGTPTASMFLGFNRHVGGSNFVLGGEVALQGWTPGDVHDNSSYEEYGIQSVMDLKAKAGTVVDMGAKPILLYGFAGVTSLTATNYYGEGYVSSGVNYGLGAEMKVSNQFGIGLEYMKRSILAYNGSSSGDGWADFQQVTLRAAFHF